MFFDKWFKKPEPESDEDFLLRFECYEQIMNQMSSFSDPILKEWVNMKVRAAKINRARSKEIVKNGGVHYLRKNTDD